MKASSNTNCWYRTAKCLSVWTKTKRGWIGFK